ncbi:MAG: hypothetical protein ABH817_01040, partial [archaeon]
VCSFDSQGNQESVLEDCNYPNGKCEICMEDECERGNTLEFGIAPPAKFGEAYCKLRTCTINLDGDQEITVSGEGLVRVKTGNHQGKETLLHGQSICYNFYMKEGRGEKSTGYQNQILRCFEGEIGIEQLGTDREELCFEKAGYTTVVVPNSANLCKSCSNYTGFWNTVGDAFLVTMFSGISKHCTEDACENLGRYTDDGFNIQMCNYNRDLQTGVFGFNFGEGEDGIGSCDPVYPIGSSETCSDCGKGNDDIYNVCDEQECFASGNCGFTQDYRPFRHLALVLPIFFATRISIAPIECVAEAIEISVRTGAPRPEAYANCLIDRTEYVNPVCWVARIGSGLFKGDEFSKGAKDWLGFASGAIGIIGGATGAIPWWVSLITAGAGFALPKIGGEEKKTTNPEPGGN